MGTSKGSYVTLSYGQLRSFEPGKPLQIADGQTIEKVDFSLPRGAIITGRIMDEYGEPIVNVQVAPMRNQYVQGRRQMFPVGQMASTNDLGEYRLFGLSPGQYYLSATLRNLMMFAESDDRSGYAPTYYPGTASVAEAQRVSVGLGQTLPEVNLTLIPMRTARISGTAVDVEGKPVSTGGMVMVVERGGGMTSMRAGGQIRPDGSFPSVDWPRVSIPFKGIS